MNLKVLKEISESWNLEAKIEKNERYFYKPASIDELISGRKNYIIGRKGTGKTALSQYISKLNNGQKIFTKSLSFKNFPYNELYEHKNEKYTPKSHYITLWKYIIYSTICEMLLKNVNISNDLRDALSASYYPDKLTALPRKISEWVSDDFKIKDIISKKDNQLSWIQKVGLLEDYILNFSDDAEYFIVFDGLDDEYSTIDNRDPNYILYINLLTGLFKAAQDVKYLALEANKKIHPLIFLRDDIYKLISDSDKTKWNDIGIELVWDVEKIKKLLSFRIMRAIDEKFQDDSILFEDAWYRIFEKKPVSYGNRQQKKINGIDFINRMTQFRPRDYIQYIQSCAKKAYDLKRNKIEPEIIRSEEKAFANYLRSETIDEIKPVLPEIEKIFTVFSEIKKQTFKIELFKEVYMEHVQNGNILQSDSNLVLKTLFEFNVIGNLPRQRNNPTFKYRNKEATFNFKEPIVINRGLYKTLQIV